MTAYTSQTTSAGWVAPRRVPQVGDVLDFASGEVRYRQAALRLQVSRVRVDISGWYGGGWVWLEGRELDPSGHPISWQQVLVSVAAIERQESQRQRGLSQ
jgi:hypothetical protein